MNSTKLLGSLAAVSVLWISASCSSKSNDTGTGAGGSGETGGSAGSSTGGTAGNNGGNAGNKASGGNGGNKASGGNAGNTASGGSAGDASAGTGGDASVGSGGTTADGSNGTGGTPPTCPGADTQTDPNNCGHCGKSCAGGDCSGGLCEAVLVIDQDTSIPGFGSPLHPDSAKGFVAQNKVYFWREDTSGSSPGYKLLSAASTPTNPVSTGEPALQTVPVDPGVGAVTFDAGNIYETLVPATKGGGGEVDVKKLADNSAPTKLFTLPAGPPDPNDGNNPSDFLWRNITIGKDAIYLAGTTQINGFSNPNPETTKIFKIATPVTNPASKPTALAPNLGETVGDLAVFGNATDGEHLFWLDVTIHRTDIPDGGVDTVPWVMTMPAAGGTPVVLDEVDTFASSFASDGTYVYWTEINDLGKLMRCPLAHPDKAHVEPVADASNAQKGIIVQGGYAYFMEFTDPGPVYRVNLTSQAHELELLGNRTVPPSIKNSYLFGADANFLYMTSIDAKVYRLPIVP